MHTSGLPADILELEISETFALNNDDAIMPLQQLHSKGIKLAFAISAPVTPRSAT